MACMSAKLFMALCDSKGLKYSVLEEEDGKDTVIKVGMGLDVTSINVIIFFEPDNERIALRGHNFVTIPESKVDSMYKVVNALNCEYRWVKYTIDKDGDACVACDAVITLDTCADETFELMLRMMNIVKDSYPVFMKAIWS